MDALSSVIDKLRFKVIEYFSSDASGHNLDHLERTLNYAQYLQSKEGGDRTVVGISAFIHDVHRIMGAEQNRFVTPKESLPVVKSFIEDLDITDKQNRYTILKKPNFFIKFHITVLKVC